MSPRFVPLVCIAIAIGAAASSTSAQQPRQQVVRDGPLTFSLDVDATSVRIADPFRMRIQVDAPRGTSITLPRIDERIGGFLVIRSRTAGELPVDGEPRLRRWVHLVELESLETGTREIPSLEILYELPEGIGEGLRRGSLRSKPIEVETVSVLGQQEDPTSFRDLKSPAESPAVSSRPNIARRVMATVGGVAAVLLIASTVWWLTRRGSAPEKWASDQVDEVESRYHGGDLDLGQAHADLAALLRSYLEAELSLPATAQSSEELSDQLVELGYPPSTIEGVTQMLRIADEVKFAGRVPAGEPDDSPFTQVRQIIRETAQHAAATPRERR